jgi:hypothetical protein
MTISLLSRWCLGITGLYVGRSVPQCPSGSLVVFPYDPHTLSCGITLSIHRVRIKMAREVDQH